MDGSSFNWSSAQSLSSPNSLTTFAGPRFSTTYVLTAFDNKGCPKPGRDTVTVTVLPPVMATAGRDTAAVVGQPLQLQASGGATYQWLPGTSLSATDIANPVANFPESYTGSIRYLVRVTTPEGCTDTASLQVRIFATNPSVFIPNAFTPNGDGRNDLLRPIAAGMQRVEVFAVYNRWGQLLFSSQDGRGWDGNASGKPQQTGVYVWMVKAIDYNGKPYIQKGTVTLLR
jgi:gliding motility-associated-like protein